MFYVSLEFPFVKNWIASKKMRSPAVPWHCFWKAEKSVELRAVCSPRPTCLLTPALEGINLYDKNSSNSSIPPSPSRDTQDNYLYVILTIFFSFRVSGPKLHLHFSFLVAYERPNSFLTIQRNEEYQWWRRCAVRSVLHNATFPAYYVQIFSYSALEPLNCVIFFLCETKF